MGEIRIVGPGITRGYPYPVCKKITYLLANAFPCLMYVCELWTFSKDGKKKTQVFDMRCY